MSLDLLELITACESECEEPHPSCGPSCCELRWVFILDFDFMNQNPNPLGFSSEPDQETINCGLPSEDIRTIDFLH